MLYALIVGGCLLAFAVARLFFWFSRSYTASITTFVLKHLIYPCVLRRRAFVGPVSRLTLAMQVAYWAIAAASNVVGVKNLDDVGSRAGSLAIFHLIPLALGGRWFGFLPSLLGLHHQTISRLHSTFGCMTLVQSAIHVGLLLRNGPLDWSRSKNRFGLIVSTLILERLAQLIL